MIELFDIHNILDLNIVGEYETRLATFTNWVLACQNVNLTGQRASGKTFTVEHVSKFLPSEGGLYNLSSGSDKAPWYQAEAMKKHTHIMIPELNKVPKVVLEILKDWGEGRASTYSVTIFEAGNRRIHKYTLPPRPFIFCLADEEELRIDEQLRSRLTVIRTDISEHQNKAVNKQQADLAMLPSNPKPFDPAKYTDIRNHIETLPPWDEEGYRHPAANLFMNCIPTIFTNCRRDFPKYLRNTYGITRFYHKDRLSTTISTLNKNNVVEKKMIYFVTPADMYYNHVIYGNILIESSLRCNNMERQLIKILQDTGDSITRTIIQAQVRKHGMNINASMITRHLRTLTDLGYVECNKDRSKPATYKVGQLFREHKFEVDWSVIIAECIKNIKAHYPDIAEQYITKYCKDPQVIHPYNGIAIRLLDIGNTAEENEVKEEEFEEDFDII